MGKRSEDKRARRKARVSQRKTSTAHRPSTPEQHFSSESTAAEAHSPHPALRETVGTPPLPRTTVLVIGDRQYGYEGELYDMQCVAKTTRGTRCGNLVEVHGQVAKWDAHGRYRLDWEAADPFWLERYGSTERLYATYVQQRCKRHVDLETTDDAVAPQIYEIGPLTPTPEDVVDTIRRRVYPGLMRMTSSEERSDHSELVPAVNAAAGGDLAALLALVSRHPLPVDLEFDRHAEHDPNYANAGLWLNLLDAWEQGFLTAEQLGQCLEVGELEPQTLA